MTTLLYDATFANGKAGDNVLINIQSLIVYFAFHPNSIYINSVFEYDDSKSPGLLSTNLYGICVFVCFSKTLINSKTLELFPVPTLYIFNPQLFDII